MLLNLCDNFTSTEETEICYLNFSSSLVSILITIIFGLNSIFLIKTNKTKCEELFYLHNARSTCGLLLILINIIEIEESILSQYPYDGYNSPPLSILCSSTSSLVLISLISFIRLIEIKDKIVWLYLVLISEVLITIPKICKLVKLTESQDITELQSTITTLSCLVFGIHILIDAYTLFKEHRSSKKTGTTFITNENVGYKHPHATFLSKIIFYWITPLLWKGYCEPLEVEDLGNLYEENTSRYQYDQFLFIYQSFKNKQISLWLCYFKFCWKMFLFGGLLKFFGDLVGLIGPLSISQVVGFIQKQYDNKSINDMNVIIKPLLNKNLIYYPTWNEFLSNGWIISVIVLLSSLAQGTLSQNSTHIVNMIGIRLKIAVQGLIYRKTLLISSSCYFSESNKINNQHKKENNQNSNNNNHVKENKKNNEKEENLEDYVTDAGAITNLMSEDAFNVMSFFWIAHYVWAIPLKIALVMYLLYQILGISAIIGSLFCIIIMTPLQFFIGKIMSSNNEKAAEYTDERLRRINEVILGMKIIKLNSWEKVFKEKICDIRNKELKKLDKDSFYWTIMTLLTHISSVLVTFVTFAVFINIEESNGKYDFTAGRIFTALALFNQLTVPLFIFPITVPIILSALVSTKRLKKFFELPEVKKEFESVQNMARVLCRSDASLDVFEIENQDENNKNKNNQYNDVLTLTPIFGNKSKNQKKEFDNEMNSGVYTLLDTFNDNYVSSTQETKLVDNLEKSNSNMTNTLKKKNQLSVNSKLERNRFKVKKVSPTISVGNIMGGGVMNAFCHIGNNNIDDGNFNKDIKQLAISDDLIVYIKNGKFSWHQKLESDVVLNVNKLEIPRGKFTIIIGKNGSGKSTLIAALLKEMEFVSGEISWNKYSTTSYVPQIPWLINGTIRENILFGEPFRPRRYDKVLEACALKPDIDLMPGGDLSEIGERGINLSGGQRQRIAIARALYSSSNVLLMDDALSSLDNEVGNYIIEKCVKKMLLRYKRTPILVTQKIHLINIADYIVVMEDNKIKTCGTLTEIEKYDPNLTREWNSIITKENLKEIPSSPGRTARERWKLFKNVSRIGLQRTNASEEDELSSTQSIFSSNQRRRSSVFGSRYLTCDIPFPIDECNNDEIELRRRQSRKSVFLSTSDAEKKSNILRVKSLQNTKKRERIRIPVSRNISSPSGLMSVVETKRDSIDVESLSSSSSRRFSIRDFIQRVSNRRSSSAAQDLASFCRDRVKLHGSASKTTSIQSISEEEQTNSHMPINKLTSTVSKCNEETEDEICSNYNEEISNRLISDEERKYGRIPTKIYMLYLKSCGLYIVTIFFLSAFIWQALRVYTDVWLQKWTDNTNGQNDEIDIFYYFKIYGVLSGICIILTAISIPAGQYCGSRARRVIHNILLESVLKNSIYYFQTTPVGRILNRFSNDMSVIDKKIAPTCQRLLQFMLLCLCAVLINTVITPWFILLTIPICAAYYFIQKFYRQSSRELQRIESITCSPIISHFSETVSGVTTIRAFNQKARFMEILFKRMEANNIAFIILNTSNRWLGIALDYLGGIIVFIALITALITSTLYPEKTVPSLIGLAINYTLLVPIYLNWVVKLLSDMEMYIGAVERVNSYIANKQNTKHELYKTVPISWPQKGDILFENVSLKYENQKENVISNFNLTIPSGQRLGICGRSGSGKSSLALSLFGMLNITEGRILIDNVNISTIHIDELRSRLSIIPQDVVLFTGTIRENLDPRGHYSDLELWNCLEIAQLKDAIKNIGLDAEIFEGGLNMSAGQRQLFCLARAVLRGSACLVLDEATSSLDSVTEIEIIKAANNAFKGRTIITIAHRLTTILDYDRIIVLENGKIIEDGDPKILKTKPNGKFSNLLNSNQIS